MFHAELITHHLCTQEFHIIDDFLPNEHYEALRILSETMYEQGLFKNAQIGRKMNTQLNDSIRRDEIYWMDDESSEPAVAAYLEQTRLLAALLNQSLFLSLVEFETHFATYPPGAFYKKHIDQFATNKSRKISCVYYLNEEWQEQFGGQLKLYNREDQLIQNILPQGNRFICFNSELPHEVAITHKRRYSMTGWMKCRGS